MKTILLSLLLIFTFSVTLAQTVFPDSLFRFSGFVLNSSDSTGIPNVHILNLCKGTGTVSAIDGSFELIIRDADSLKISCVGFRDRYLLINKYLLRDNAMIFIEKDTIMMDELLVHILGPRRYFKHVFMDLKLPEKEEVSINPNFLIFKKGEIVMPPYGIQATGPVQLLYDAFNKKARLRRKLENNRKRYSRYLNPVVADSLVYPDNPQIE